MSHLLGGSIDKRIIWPMTFIVIAIASWLLIARSCGELKLNFGSKTYHIGRDNNWSTIDLMGKEKNMEGFTSDLINAIGSDQNLHLEIVNGSPSALSQALHDNVIDGVLSNIDETPQNQNRYHFSDPFFVLGPVLVVRRDAHITDLAEMAGKIIGISSTSPLRANIVKIDAIFIPYENMTQALDDLVQNKIDGVIMGVLSANILATSLFAGKVKIVTEPLLDNELELYTLKNSEGAELVRRFNASLNELIKSGEYDELIRKWGLVNTKTFRPQL